jgi:hypothetical protein
VELRNQPRVGSENTDRFVIIAVADANIDELLRVTANILSAARLLANYD